MITYSNIKAYNQIWSPMGRYPMIDNTIFETYNEALAFATTNAVAVVGNIVTVTSDPDASKNGAYILICDGKLTSASQPTGLKKLGSDIDLSNYVTKDQLTSIYTYKGSKATFAELPVVDVAVGDVWNVEEAYENHPAGTNWVWDGEKWDALAGSVDLSGYALKADVEASVATLTGNVATNTGAIAEINTALANKVEKVEGSSLITAEKLELIDTNAGEISALKAVDSALDARLKVVEGAFKGEGGEIDLGDLTTQLTDHGTRIVALEGANTTNQANITTLQGEVSGHSGRLTAIETLNTEQSNQIAGLTTRVENVEKHGEAITNLTTLVNGHTESISTLTTGVADAKALATSEAAKAEAAAKQFATDEIGKLSFDEAGTAKSLADAAEANAKSYADGKFQVIGNYEIAGTAAELNAAMDTRVKVLEAVDHAKLATDAAASAVATVLDDAPEAFDTLKEVAEWIANNDHASDVATLVTDVAALKSINHEAYIAADETVLASAKSYADEEIAKLSFDAAGTAKTLADQALVDAKAYTDGKVGELGTAAYKNVEFFATAAQGALAETAAQQATTYTKTEVDTLLGDAFSWVNIE